MATIDNIKDLIKNKIEGQGSQVDIGNGLPSVLNGMAELIENSQGLLGKGYLFMGFYHISQIPEVPESGNYFILCDDFSGENPVLSIEVSDDGSWVSVAEFYIYNTANLIENNREESDGYVTPAGIVDYCKDFGRIFDANGLTFVQNDIGEVAEVSPDIAENIRQGIGVAYDGTVFPRFPFTSNLGNFLDTRTDVMHATIYAIFGLSTFTYDSNLNMVFDEDGYVLFILYEYDGVYYLYHQEI